MKRLFISATTLLLIGCGSGSGSNPASSVPAEEDVSKDGGMKMSLLETYEVYPGDSVKKLSEDAMITITHNDGEVQSSVKLIEGKAELVRKI